MTTAEKQDRLEEIQNHAKRLFAQDPDWATFYRRILGLQGVVRERFSSRPAMDEFEQTEAFMQIQRMLKKLREKRPLPEDPEDPTRVITVRLPKSLHDTLRSEAFEHQTSMNKLCISKLLQFIDDKFIPSHT